MTLGHADIYSRIRDFNKMFGLPAPAVPTLGTRDDLLARLKRFKEIILKEVDEVDDIVSSIENGTEPLEVAVMLADWHMDIVVYAISETTRFGIPAELILHAIMDSQRSKMGADGMPIVKDGKIVKGPNYVAPEPMIRGILSSLIHAHTWEQRA